MKTEKVYLLSEWESNPENFRFMERDLIRGKIPYGIIMKHGKFALIREPVLGLESVTLEFDEWYKPFKPLSKNKKK